MSWGVSGTEATLTLQECHNLAMLPADNDQIETLHIT
jgi:hypothetical protein